MTWEARCSGLVLVGWLLAALWGLLHWQAQPGIVLERMFDLPSLDAWFGYDALGRPIAQRVIAGAATSCTVAFGVVAIAACVGTAIGLIAAWSGGWLDLSLLRIMDTFMAFPGILLAIALSSVLGPGLSNVVIALAVMSWVGFARLARAQTLSIRTLDHVEVARALGTRPYRILWRHVLPLLVAPLVVEATFAIAGVVIAEAGLSFLGLGAQPPTPSWGSMIKDATQYMLVAPHMLIGPGLALLSLVVSVNILGDRLRDRWNVMASDA